MSGATAPSCSSKSEPQHLTSPADLTAHVWPRPAEVDVTAVSGPDVSVGTDRFVVEPSPSCPYKFKPQQETLLIPPNAAHVWSLPAERAFTNAEPKPMGTVLHSKFDWHVSVVATPNSPKRFDPQQNRSARLYAQVWPKPAAIPWTPLVRPRTWTGVERLVVLPSPSWPFSLPPQHIAAPAVVTAHVWFAPAEMAAMPLDKPTTSMGVDVHGKGSPITEHTACAVPPNWPELSDPQHFALPAFVTTQAWFPPTETIAAPAAAAGGRSSAANRTSETRAHSPVSISARIMPRAVYKLRSAA
jgi:hypothetical protein